VSDNVPMTGLENPRCMVEETPSGGAFRRLVGNSKFRRLWLAQFVSSTGDWLVIGLLIPIVTTLSGGSSFAVAGIMIAKILPALVLSSVTGVIVDRFDRRWVMIVADLARAALTLFLLFTNSLAAIYLVVLLMEIGSLFFYPARNALIPYLLDDETDVAAANGLAYTTQQAAMLFGLVAAGAIIAAFETAVRYVLSAGLPIVSQMVGLFAPQLIGPRAGVVLNTFTFLFSAIVMLTIRIKARPPRSEERFTLRLLGRDAIDSFKFLGAHRELRGLLTVIFLALLGGGAIIAVAPAYVGTLSKLANSAVPFAGQIPVLAQLVGAPQTFMLVFLALGMVVGALMAPRLERHMSLQLMFAGSVTAFGAALLLFAFITVYALVGFFAFAAGFCVAMVTVAGNTYVVHTVDDSIRGRVFTALESVIRVALLASMVLMAPLGDIAARLLSGLIGETLNVTDFFADPTLAAQRMTLILSGTIVLAAAVYAWRTLSWRREDAQAPEAGLHG